MNGIFTPTNFVDGHTDVTRPEGATATFNIHGAPRFCAWSSQFRLWFPQSNVAIQLSSPFGSPASPTTIPLLAGQIVRQQPTMGARLNVVEPAPTLSAKMYLDLLPPPITVNQMGSPRPSSAANLNYANIGPMTKLPLPHDLSGYKELPVTLRYHPVQADPTLSLSVEADAIRAIYNYIVGPVNCVLYDNSYYSITGEYCIIRTRSEDTHSVEVGLDPSRPDLIVSHVSRVDLSREVFVGNMWHKFAFARV